MTQTIGQWVHAHPDLLLGLVLIAVAYAIVLVLRIREVTREVDAVLGRRRPNDEPPVEEWAAELEEHG